MHKAIVFQGNGVGYDAHRGAHVCTKCIKIETRLATFYNVDIANFKPYTIRPYAI